MSEQLVHYSANPLGELYSVDPAKKGRGWYKPNGLWVSVDGNGDGWKEWCVGEDFNTKNLAIAHLIELAKDANILRLTSDADLFSFTKEYQILGERRYDIKINWVRIGQEYQGIIIAPYCWECRLDDRTFWYYGWDCASGCIWDAKAIASFRHVDHAEIDA